MDNGTLLLYSPNKVRGAPDLVAKNIVEAISKRKEKIKGEILIFKNLKNDVFKSLKSPIIHIPSSFTIIPNSKFFLYLLSRLRGKNLIMNLHGIPLIDINNFNLINIPHYYLYPNVLKTVENLIVNSQRMSELLKQDYDIKNDVIIPNGIETWWFEKDNRNFELEGDPAIFYHGRFIAEKNISQLLHGFKKGVKSNKNVKLYLAGDGPQENYLKKLCIELDIKDQVFFLGLCDRKKIKSYLNNSTVSIYPSLFEPFSLSILEALAACKGPVFYSKGAGIDDFATLKEYKFQTFYPYLDDIVETIDNIIEENYDNSITKQQKEFAKCLTWDKISEDYLRLYNQLLEN